MGKKAFVLITVSEGKTKTATATRIMDIYHKLNTIEKIEAAYMVTGPYAIIAIIDGNDLGEIGAVVTSEISTIQGIERAVTCAELNRDTIEQLSEDMVAVNP